MNILAITIEALQLAGVSIVVVFAILVALVVLLEIFSMVANKKPKENTAPKNTQASATIPVADADEEEKAAIAVALYLYEKEKNSLENQVLTLTYHNKVWNSQLNPRL